MKTILNKYIFITITALIAPIAINSASWSSLTSWFGYGKANITEADKTLLQGVKDGDFETIITALQQGANPNAKIDGNTSIIVDAFELALNRDRDGLIVSDNRERTKILLELLDAGGNLQEIQNHINSTYIIKGFPMYYRFKDNPHTGQRIPFTAFKRLLANIGLLTPGI